MVDKNKRVNGYAWMAAFLITILVPAAAIGHTLFIQSSQYQVHQGKQSPFFFCYGHRVPVDDGVQAKKLKYIRVYQPDGEVRDVSIRNETGLHSYMVNYDAPGTYALAAETTPGYYTIYVDKKGRERHAIKPKSAVIDQAREIKLSLYSRQYTKTYVVCDTPSATFPARIGLPLELSPTKDISTLKPGDVLELKVFLDGKPFVGEGTWSATYNGYSTEIEDNAYPKTSVSGDTVRIPIPFAGRWFVRYSFNIDAPEKDRAQCDHLKSTASLVFEIPNDRKNRQ